MEFVPWEVEIVKGQGCCGLAALSAGMEKMALSQMERNIEAFSGKGFEILLTGCASCASMLKRYPNLLPDDHPMRAQAEALAGRVMEFSSLLAEMVQGQLPPGAPDGLKALPSTGVKSALQVPCHQRYGLGTIEGLKEAASLLGIVFDMELGCCGFGGTFFLKHKGLSEAIRSEALEECRRADVNTIVTTCSGCLLNWHLAQRAHAGPRPLHLAQYLLHSCNGSMNRG
jgi:glycolate oxidase iron-sulfur subunit